MDMDSPFSTLSTELILSIICSCASFSDILAFSATCQRHRQIVIVNANVVYQKTSPRLVQYRNHVRNLIADQGCASADAPVLEFRDLLQIIHNTTAMERTIEHFNEKYMHRILTGDMYAWGGKPRPKYLTPTEQHRVVRTAYNLWSLLILDPAERKSRIESFKLKDLRQIYEFASRFHYSAGIIQEKAILATVDHYKSDLRDDIHDDIRPRLESELKRVHGRGIEVLEFPYGDGLLGCISLWDDYQDTFKDLILVAGQEANICPVPEHTLWSDTSDEE